MNEENEFLNKKIDLVAGWLKKSFQLDLDPKSIENFKKIAARSSITLENLVTKIMASLDNKQPVERNITFESLFLRLQKFLPRLTEADAQKIFTTLKTLAKKEIERRRNRRF